MIGFGFEAGSVSLCEGQYACEHGSDLFVGEVYRYGIPGELTRIGIARKHPALTRQDIIEATEQITGRQFSRR